MSLIFLDTETTDCDANARLIQLAYKHMPGGTVVNEYFKPPVPISFGAMATHHVTNEMAADKPMFEGSRHQNTLRELLKTSAVVAHNAPFDIMILKNDGLEVQEYIDTLRIARHILDSEQYALQYLRYSLNLGVQGVAHDALGDIMVLEALFEYLKMHIAEKFSLGSEQEILEKMFELTQMPVLLQSFTFGKYKGKTFEEVADIDQNYLQWLYGSETMKPEHDQNEDLVWTLKTHIT
ncbi:MAG: exonuclease domain-containing protein [Candidatus Magasanikbacteria bacterium]